MDGDVLTVPQEPSPPRGRQVQVKIGGAERDDDGRWQARLEPSHAGLQRDAAQFLGLLLDNPEP